MEINLKPPDRRVEVVTRISSRFRVFSLLNQSDLGRAPDSIDTSSCEWKATKRNSRRRDRFLRCHAHQSADLMIFYCENALIDARSRRAGPQRIQSY